MPVNRAVDSQQTQYIVQTATHDDLRPTRSVAARRKLSTTSTDNNKTVRRRRQRHSGGDNKIITRRNRQFIVATAYVYTGSSVDQPVRKSSPGEQNDSLLYTRRRRSTPQKAVHHRRCINEHRSSRLGPTRRWVTTTCLLQRRRSVDASRALVDNKLKARRLRGVARRRTHVTGHPSVCHTRLYSFRFNCRIVSLTAANTNRMFSVSATNTQPTSSVSASHSSTDTKKSRTFQDPMKNF